MKTEKEIQAYLDSLCPECETERDIIQMDDLPVDMQNELEKMKKKNPVVYSCYGCGRTSVSFDFKVDF